MNKDADMELRAVQHRIHNLEVALAPFAKFRHQASGEKSVIVAGPWRIEGSSETRSLITIGDIDRACRVYNGGEP